MIGSNHRSPGTGLKLLFNKQRRVHTTGYSGTQSQPQNPPQTNINIISKELQIFQQWKTGKVLARATISQLH